jgi:Sulfotransferase family
VRARLGRLRRSTELHVQAARVLVPRGRGAGLRRLGRLDGRAVFVVGSPRSGTTFLGRSIGSLPSFIDLGELAPFKAAIPELAALGEAEAARRIRRTLALARCTGLVPGLRPVEQTPDAAFVVGAIRRAFPEARVIHAVRDGRDVVASLQELGWLRAGVAAVDDVGAAFGSGPRAWVEPRRADEFVTTSDARRAAWAWRRYVTAARAGGDDVLEVRYERTVASPSAVAEEIAEFLDVPAEPLAAAFGAVSGASVGRYARDLSDEEMADVLAEAGDLLGELGYL